MKYTITYYYVHLWILEQYLNMKFASRQKIAKQHKVANQQGSVHMNESNV
jgi:hypothetical protein